MQFLPPFDNHPLQPQPHHFLIAYRVLLDQNTIETFNIETEAQSFTHAYTIATALAHGSALALKRQPNHATIIAITTTDFIVHEAKRFYVPEEE